MVQLLFACPLLLLSWELRLLGVLVGTLAAATAIHWSSSSSRWTASSPGLRLATAAPLTVAFAAAPLLFDRAVEPVTTVFTAFLLTWLGIFKMLAWAAGRGASCTHLGAAVAAVARRLSLL